MFNRLARSSFGMRTGEPLTDSQLFNVAPSIFATGKHESRSDRYAYIPTIDVLNGLRREGFQPYMAAQSRSRIPGKSEFTKHMIRLRQPGELALNNEFFEIVLINSHDGTSSYQMMSGMFRLVCTNGMIRGDIETDVRVPHKGDITSNVIDAAFKILGESDGIRESMEEMKSTRLSLPESHAFAEAALSLKYEDGEAPFAAEKLLQPRRQADLKDDLWTTFNRVQENMIKGGVHGITKNFSRTTTRPVTSIDTNVRLNKALWMLADKMADLKTVAKAG